jgi:anaerobic selenocysteine-containing dehydrogenase
MPLDPIPQRTVVRGACPHDCPDTCAMLVTVEDGKAIQIRGAPDHPPTGGTLCTKVARYLERTYSKERVLHPMRRVGRKGEGRFERISWDEALDTIAEKFAAIAASPDGPQAIVPYSYAGTMGLLQYSSMDRRFFHRLGASLLDRTICATAGKGRLGGDDRRRDRDGRRAIREQPPHLDLGQQSHHVQSASLDARAGGEAPGRAPGRHRSLPQPDRGEVPRAHCALPGTDAALALGMMHVLIAEDLVDHDYVARHTIGFDALRERAAEYPPDRVARICGIAPDTVTALARAYGTTAPRRFA